MVRELKSGGEKSYPTRPRNFSLLLARSARSCRSNCRTCGIGCWNASSHEVMDDGSIGADMLRRRVGGGPVSERLSQFGGTRIPLWLVYAAGIVENVQKCKSIASRVCGIGSNTRAGRHQE